MKSETNGNMVSLDLVRRVSSGGCEWQIVIFTFHSMSSPTEQDLYCGGPKFNYNLIYTFTIGVILQP